MNAVRQGASNFHISIHYSQAMELLKVHSSLPGFCNLCGIQMHREWVNGE